MCGARGVRAGGMVTNWKRGWGRASGSMALSLGSRMCPAVHWHDGVRTQKYELRKPQVEPVGATAVAGLEASCSD